MTDKQIINQEEAIKMIKKLNEKLKNVDDYIVELRSNFYRMKQDLDRKEQECQDLKIYIESNEQQVKEVETLVMDNDRLINELDQLKAKNEELKNAYARLNSLYNDNCDYTDKLEKTITEIKEIAEDTKDKFYDAIHTGGLYDRLEQIIRKINECEVNNEC